MFVMIFMLFESFSDHVVTEVSERNMMLFIMLFQNLSKSLAWIGNLNVPVIYENRATLNKFNLWNSSLTADIQSFEIFPKLIVNSQIDQQKFEDSFRN